MEKIDVRLESCMMKNIYDEDLTLKYNHLTLTLTE